MFQTLRSARLASPRMVYCEMRLNVRNRDIGLASRALVHETIISKIHERHKKANERSSSQLLLRQ